MFTQKKKNYKTAIYTAIVITLCLLIVALAWPKDEAGTVQTGNQTKISAEEKVNDKNEENTNNNANYNTYEEEWDDEPIEKNDISGNQNSYYLVKHKNGQIKVYFVDTAGNEIELETTEILYEMLGPEDQSLFDNGYKVNSQEELAVLLQDFES